ncbi:MAG: diguanylate cyclase [Bacteroidota bacterium]
MLHRLKESSFTTQWLILVMALLTLGGATGFNLHTERERTQSREEARLLTQARVIQENLEQQLAAVSRVLVDIRQELPQHGARPRLNDYLGILTDAMPGVRSFLLLTGDGTVSAASQPALLGATFADRDYFRTARRTPDPDTLFVSPPSMAATDLYVINVARVVSGPAGEFSGLVVATLDPDYFKTLMASVLYAPDMWTAIAHGDGIQFLTVPELPGQPGRDLAHPGSFFSRHMASGQQLNMLTSVVQATGDRRMIAMRSIQPARLHPDKPLIVAVSRDLGAVFEPWRHDARSQGGLLALTASLAIAGLAVHQRRQRGYAQKEAEAAQALASSEYFMKTLTDNIPGMVAYWNSDLRCAFANQAYFDWFGKTPEQMRGIRIQDMMGETLFHLNEPYIRAALRGERQHFERTLTRVDGSVRHTWAQYIPDIDGDRVRGFFVLVSDITELKQTEIALAESERKLKTIIEAEPECVNVLAVDGSVLQINRAGLDMLEADSEEQIRGRPLTDLIVAHYRDAFVALNDKVNAGESGSLEFEIAGLKGGRHWLDMHAVPMRDINCRISGLLGVARDITARKEFEQELARLAQTDFLTNLVNRRHFMMLAELELSRTLRYGGPLSILMMDIDRFKKINDAYGHKTGDVVLQRFAELSRQVLRDIDVIGRIGGEEFAVLLLQTDGEHALDVAERLRRATADAAIDLDLDKPIHFTISIGVATLSETAASIDTLLSQADQALYQAKNGGRNRVCVYEARVEPALPATSRES